MSLWRLRLGFLFCLIVRAVHAESNQTINEIPDSYVKLAEGNSLWTGLLRNCKNPSISCVQKNVFDYFKDLLEYPHDFKVIDSITFSKNKVNYDDIDNGIGDKEDVARTSPFEEVSNALHNKAVKFMMTHDIDFKLPELFFEGASLKISPRTIDGDGALFKLDVVPSQGRIFFKKIKKFISERLLIALLAIVLVIKLIAVKILFFLPMILGVAAAKKLLLKILLFVFPVLSHLFKLCPYYQPTKLHHHQHHISHVHHLPHLPPLHHGIESDHPPPGYPHHDHNLDYYSEGPGLLDYHRKNSNDKSHEPGEENDIPWSSGQGQSSNLKHDVRLPPGRNRPLTPTEIENMILKAEHEATLKARLQEEHKRVELENKRLQDHIKQLIKVQEKLKLQSVILKQNSKLVAANILQNANIVPAANVIHHSPIVHALPAATLQHPYLQPSVVQHPPLAQALPMYQQPNFQVGAYHATTTAAPPIFDAFYSPILEKIDKIFVGLDINEEPCRERLICSMYKNPQKFSPHSNLISVELSRDFNELQKPTSTNSAVIRFYRYVQAARDGQDKRDCIRLYPTCAINTEN